MTGERKIFFINSGYIGGLLRDRILMDDIRDLFTRKGIATYH
jgi:hypothetical protein